jgi:DNA polymerase III delta prime subunit
MTSLTWPDGNTLKRLHQIIFETQLNPFGLATYKSGQTLNDFVGRQEELNRFKEEIKKVIQYKQSRAVRLEGPAGVGKSTLFNYLKESIEKERAGEKGSSIQYLLADIDIFSTYFVLPDQIIEFASIWKPLFEGLYAGFDRETGADISLPEYVAFHLIYRMFLRDPAGLQGLIWSKSPPPTNLHTVQLRDLIDPIRRGGSAAIPRLQAYFNEHKRELRDELTITIGGEKYELRRTDNTLINNLFRSIDEDDPDNYLEKVHTGAHDLFKNNDELVAYFNDLCRIYTCCAKKQPLFLIGIDEFAKSDLTARTEYYTQLGNLMIKLRNSLNNILFVFISTTEDWQNYDSVINANLGLAGQISGFMVAINLRSLTTDELIQVFRNRMTHFWQHYSADQPQLAPYFPFNDAVFEYVYLFHKRRLRESINFLGEMWANFHYKNHIPKMETIFEAMREIRQIAQTPLDPATIQRFEWEIIAKAFNHPTRFTTNGTRSAAIETGVEMAWKALAKGQFPEITNVENNNVIHTSSGKRRPDVYLTIHGNLGAEYRRHVEFQIKAYAPNAFVELKHIESSLELFNEQYTDFIYFLITGKGLHPDAEAKVKDLERQYPTRIRRPPLFDNQIEALYFLAMYNEVVGRPLGSQPQDEAIAKAMLERILKQRIEDFIMEIKGLAYRSPIGGSMSSQESPITPPTLLTPDKGAPSLLDQMIKQPPITPAFGDCSSSPNPPENPPNISSAAQATPVENKSTTKPPAAWLTIYPAFVQYRLELCALCLYLQEREGTNNQGKFTIATVEKNAIQPNASLDRKKFKLLVTKLKDEGYLIPEKSSLKLTKTGNALYAAIKSEKFSC